MLHEKTSLFSCYNDRRWLLHACCAPCSGSIMETLLAQQIDYTVFFYNPNIHPLEEYEIRKHEIKQFAKKLKVPFVDADYDVENWFTHVHGLEQEPERGERCTACFTLRLAKTAQYAHTHGFSVFATSLGISRWKNVEQVNECGQQVAQHYPKLVYWGYNWRKQGGAQQAITIAKREKFYRQTYCGCIYSLNGKYKNERIEIIKNIMEL
ncbi:MAG: hypothetical protein BWK79_17960 [Beggiatoa sp. IS2]|nr:MAG: hypothetical protein BWK79_17960 [Beggiatoa sp. IS2]